MSRHLVLGVALISLRVDQPETTATNLSRFRASLLTIIDKSQVIATAAPGLLAKLIDQTRARVFQVGADLVGGERHGGRRPASGGILEMSAGKIMAHQLLHQRRIVPRAHRDR